MHLIDLNTPAEGRCGCHPRLCTVGQHPRFKVWGTVDDAPIIPRSQWKTVSLRDKVWEIANQLQQNSCCPTATRGAYEIIRELMGLKRIRLSQCSLYTQINGGRDQGANIMDALTAMMDVGIAPHSIVDQYNMNERTYPAVWKDHASKFRILEAFDCPTFDAMISAVHLGMPVVFGVNWTGGGGHAIVCVGYDLETNSAEILNSWGEEWGDVGFGNLTERQCKAITSYGAFALRGIVIPSDEAEVLPPMPS
jgi:hypothetical protein